MFIVLFNVYLKNTNIVLFNVYPGYHAVRLMNKIVYRKYRCVSISLSLSLSIYIYIYMYI